MPTLTAPVNLDGSQGYAPMIEMGKPNGEKATVEEVANALSCNCRIVGTPESVADELALWQDAGVDGINMVCQLHPDTYIDLIDHVTRLPDDHPGAAHRGAVSYKSPFGIGSNEEADNS